jgi:hypothetical protein
LGDGKGTRFWEDIWVDDHALKDDYPRLYSLCFDHNITVTQAIPKEWQGFRFRRTLSGETLELWNSLKDRCEEVEMGEGRDTIEWTLTADKKFSVKTLYREMVTENCNYPKKNCGK